MIDSHGRWYPRLSPKQIQAYNDNRRHQLMSGPRLCGKTIVAVHKAIKHAWLYNNARVGIFVKSTKVGKVGIWDDLITYALPEWCSGMEAEGFKITVGPAIDGATRMHYIKIANRHGGESELQLHSLHHDDSVEEKLKGSRYSLLLFDECDAYESEEVFNISVLQLRLIGLAHEQHQWIGTTNPAGDQDHWLYQKFYVAPFDERKDAKYRASFGLHEFKLLDNIYLSQDSITTLKETYASDPEMYDRMVNGLWVPNLRSTHFAGAFHPNQHVKGDAQEGTVIIPHGGEIIVGYDIGDRNHAVIFLERTVSANGEYWSVLDELSHIGEDISIEVLTHEVLAKMAELEALTGRTLVFKHWSDRSAFDRYRSAADAKDHILVHRYSAGKIDLIGCPKPPHSVAARIAVVRQLLVEKRLYVSANCSGIIEMFKKLSKGKTKGDLIKRDKAGHIHRFDAMSYALYGELIDQIEDSLRPMVGSRSSDSFSL